MESKIINFSIGQAVAAIAIIIALFSIAKPIFHFRYKVKKLKLKVAVGCLIVSIGFVFVAAFLPSIQKDQTIHRFYNIDYALFWELFAGLLFCLGALSVLEIHFKPVKFRARGQVLFLALIPLLKKHICNILQVFPCQTFHLN